MKFFMILLMITLSRNVLAEEKDKVIYKYKKYEKFEFDEIGIQGDGESPGDLSIINRTQTGFKSKLPYRKNFNQEMIKSIERIR